MPRQKEVRTEAIKEIAAVRSVCGQLITSAASGVKPSCESIASATGVGLEMVERILLALADEVRIDITHVTTGDYEAEKAPKNKSFLKYL